MLVLGGTYALLGIGLTLIFGIMNVVNFTHGVLYTFGAYIMFIVVHQLGVNFFLALPLAVAAGWLLGAAIEKAGKAEPAAIKAALWDINIKGLNGDIVFRKSGPEGKESGQSQPNVYLIEITDGKIGMKTL